MADKIIKRDSIFAVTTEVTEGTYVAPASATDGYFQPEESGVNEIMKHNLQLLDRGVLTSTLTMAKPQRGMKTAMGSILVEVRGSGTEGQAPAHGVLFESLLGSKHAITANVTTKNSGNTQTVLQIQDADIAKFVIGDIFVVKQSGEHSFQYVTAVDVTGGAANITVAPGRASGSFSNSVVLSKSVTYKPADSGHPTFDVSQYDANVILRKAAGCRSKGMAITDFSTGKIAKMKIDYEGLSYDETVTASPYTPTYDTALPPVILGATAMYNAANVKVNEVDLSVEQPLAFLTSVASANGRVSGRATGTRKITGKLAPYKDDGSVTYFTAWQAGTSYSLLIGAYTPSGTAGEFTMGTCFALYLPQSVIVEKPVDDLEGVLRDAISFMAHGGVTGGSPEIAMAFI